MHQFQIMSTRIFETVGKPYVATRCCSNKAPRYPEVSSSHEAERRQYKLG